MVGRGNTNVWECTFEFKWSATEARMSGNARLECLGVWRKSNLDDMVAAIENDLGMLAT